MKIKTKISLLSVLSILFVSVLIMGTLYYSLSQSSRKRIADYRFDLIKEKTQFLKEITENAHSIIKSAYTDYSFDLQSGKATPNDSQRYIKQAMKIIDSIRFGDNGYFYVYKFDGTNVLLPVKKELEGKNLLGNKDKNGVLYVKELIEKGKSGFGTVEYIFFNPAENADSPKLGCAMGFEPWKLMVGTGIYINDVDAKVKLYSESVKKDLRDGIIFISIIVVLVLIITLVIVALVVKKIGKNLNSMDTAFTNIAQNLDLSARVETHSNDEIGSVAVNFNTLVDKIKGTMSEISVVAMSLASSSEQLSAGADSFAQNATSQGSTTEEITATVEEMAAGMENILAGSEAQFERLKLLGERIKELSAMSNEMSGQITKAYELTNLITDKAEDGERTLLNMKKSMDKISDSSKDVTNIIGIINDISEHINLLSLNAAIEAARAGEAGRGFAVVADEISNLADQTASSIKDIDRIITGNEKEISVGRDTADKTVSLIKSIIDGISSVNQMMNSISSAMKKQEEFNSMVNGDAVEIQSRADEIKRASHEQKYATEEISKATININDLAQQNAAGSEQVASNADNVAHLAETLNQKINQFKL